MVVIGLSQCCVVAGVSLLFGRCVTLAWQVCDSSVAVCGL